MGSSVNTINKGLNDNIVVISSFFDTNTLLFTYISTTTKLTDLKIFTIIYILILLETQGNMKPLQLYICDLF